MKPMQIAQLAAKLQSLGLTDKEARVYVASLFLGPASVQRIAEQAEINRPTAYSILDELMANGLMSQTTQDRKTVYVAEDPQALERWLESQKAKLDAKKKDLKELLPELAGMERSDDDAAGMPVVRFFKDDSVQMINGYALRKAKAGSTLYTLVNVDQVVRAYPDADPSQPGGRMKKKIASRMIYSYSQGDVVTDPKILRETKKIDKPVAAEIVAYDEIVDITTYESDSPTGILIESPAVAQAIRQLFELAWKASDEPKKKRQ
jgi:predicted transcriptional regulator